MSLKEKLENALRSPEPARALRDAIQQAYRDGSSREFIYSALEEFLILLRKSKDHSETDEDLILDLMDAVTGWCHPSAQLGG
jgi:uncharacterized protein (UPF0335 family)